MEDLLPRLHEYFVALTIQSPLAANHASDSTALSVAIGKLCIPRGGFASELAIGKRAD